MPLTKPLGLIAESDLLELIAQQDSESRSLDYKTTLSLDDEGAKTELRKDIVSFANSVGGDLIIGMREQSGLPTELCGFDLPTQSAELYQQRILSILLSRVKPRVQGIVVRAFQLSNGKWAAVVRIPQSFTRPHQVEVGNKDFQFWFRHDGSKERMDVDELRSAILMSETLAERIRGFRADRLAGIASGDASVPLIVGTKIVLHIVPLNAFNSGVRYDLMPICQSNINDIKPIYSRLQDSPRFNFDGIIGDDRHLDEAASGSYVQVFHNGCIEAVEGTLFNYGDGKGLDMPRIEDYILSAAARYFSIQQRLGVKPPVLLMLSFLNIQGYYMAGDDHLYRTYPNRTIDQRNLIVPEEVIDDFPADVGGAMRPVFDRIWNAAGWPASLGYDAIGNRTKA